LQLGVSRPSIFVDLQALAGSRKLLTLISAPVINDAFESHIVRRMYADFPRAEAYFFLGFERWKFQVQRPLNKIHFQHRVAQEAGVLVLKVSCRGLRRETRNVWDDRITGRM